MTSAMTFAEFDLSVFGVSQGRVSAAPPDLAERVRDGDVQAVAEAYDQFADTVRAFARRLTGDPEAAEDLVHDVFVTLPSAIRNFRGESSFKTFLVSIAVNHSRHHLRAAARRRVAMQRYAEQPEPSADDPEHQARRRQLADLLSSALDELPIDQRVAFVLCDVEERPSPEVASIVGVPEATVRTRLFHARRKLRERLERIGVER
jgi:RNA polymerase sigma-70 factor (ECF subfamily)